MLGPTLHTSPWVSASSAALGGEVLMITLKMALLVPGVLDSYQRVNTRMVSNPFHRDKCEPTTAGGLWCWPQVGCGGLRENSSPHPVYQRKMNKNLPCDAPKPTRSSVLLLTTPFQVREECCLPLGVHVLISLKHDGVRVTLEAFSATTPFPFTLHSPTTSLHCC